MTDRLERSKQTVTAFYDLMFNRCCLSESPHPTPAHTTRSRPA